LTSQALTDKPKYQHTTKSKGYKAAYKLSHYGAWYRRWRALLVKAFGGRCQWEKLTGTPCDCTTQSELEFAHIKETPLSNTQDGRGSYTRLKDIVDNPDAYALLCTDHHKIYDGRDNNL